MVDMVPCLTVRFVCGVSPGKERSCRVMGSRHMYRRVCGRAVCSAPRMGRVSNGLYARLYTRTGR